MTTSGVSGFGTTLSWNGTTLAELKKIGGPKFKVNTINLTSHASPSGFAEFAGGIGDAGEISIEGNLIAGDTSGQIAMITDMTTKTARAFVITGPSSLFTWTGNAIVTAYEPSHPFDAELSFTATLKITGLPVLAVSASANLTGLTGIEENAGAALTFTPAFAGATKEYNIAINTASTWVKVTPTLAGATITITAGSAVQTVASGAQSGTIAVTDGVVTTVYLDVKETGKVANRYTLHIYTP